MPFRLHATCVLCLVSLSTNYSTTWVWPELKRLVSKVEFSNDVGPVGFWPTLNLKPEDATKKRCPVFAPNAFPLELYLMAEIGDD